MADGRSDSRELAGRDRRADAGAADEHPAFRVASLDRRSDLLGLDRIVDPFGIRVGAQVHHGMTVEHLEHCVTKMDAAVVECNRHLHVWTVPHPRQSRRPAS